MRLPQSMMPCPVRPLIAFCFACAHFLVCYFVWITHQRSASVQRATSSSPECRAWNSGKLATPKLRPCEHQVAGHLFEDGKAGSLIDDRGHFYKPLQRGPRGDRERAFYAAIAELLQAEAAQQPVGAAAARSHEAALHADGRAAGSNEGGSPTVCLNGGSACGSPFSAWQEAPRCGDGSPAVKLPWKSAKQLMELFPSFKASQRERGPMEVMQRDEIGLLSNLDLYGGSPTSSLDQEEALQEQQGQQALDCSCSRPCGARLGAAGDAQAATEQLDLQYGRSPDSSDDCSEHTGRQLMHAYCNSSDSVPGSSRAPPGADGGEAAAAEETTSTSSLQQAELAALAEGGPATRSSHHVQLAAAVEQQQKQQQAPCPQHQQVPQRLLHTTASADEAYTQPEHAQVAALLGQPVYDPALSSLLDAEQPGGAPVRPQGAPASAPAVVPSSSKPHRSPFMSDLLHHTHPPGPQEVRSSAAEGEQPCVPGSGAAAAPAGPAGSGAAASLPGCAGPFERSGEAFWVPEEEESMSLEVVAQGGASAFSSLPFSVRNAPLLRVVPKYYGTAPHADGRTLLELEDLACAYRHPCIIDIKIGFRTWYPEADPAYIQRCREKDKSTTQAALGFKICGMQVFRHGAGGYWRASKRWCKTLPAGLVDKALHSFAHNEHGLRPSDVYGGPGGAIAQLEALESWFAVQRDFRFYSSSVLVLYEGGAASPEGAKVRVRLVDFAHTFFQGEPPSPRAPAPHRNGAAAAPQQGSSPGGASALCVWQQQQRRRDTNFLAGLRALLARLRAVVHAQLQAELA